METPVVESNFARQLKNEFLLGEKMGNFLFEGTCCNVQFPQLRQSKAGHWPDGKNRPSTAEIRDERPTSC